MIGNQFEVKYFLIQKNVIISRHLDHVGLDKDENISKEKFLALNDFEVQNKDANEQDLWAGLKSLGFNYALELDMVCHQKIVSNFLDFSFFRCVHLV